MSSLNDFYPSAGKLSWKLRLRKVRNQFRSQGQWSGRPRAHQVSCAQTHLSTTKPKVLRWWGPQSTVASGEIGCLHLLRALEAGALAVGHIRIILTSGSAVCSNRRPSPLRCFLCPSLSHPPFFLSNIGLVCVSPDFGPGCFSGCWVSVTGRDASLWSLRPPPLPNP